MLSTSLTEAYAPGKKVTCVLAPLAHLGLKRIPVQTYLGRILYQFDAGFHRVEPQYVFATPHGIQLVAGESQLLEPTAEQYRELDELEEKATAAEKVLYGGDASMAELIQRLTKPLKK